MFYYILKQGEMGYVVHSNYCLQREYSVANHLILPWIDFTFEFALFWYKILVIIVKATLGETNVHARL